MNKLLSSCVLWLCQLAFFTQVGWANGNRFLPTPPWVDATNESYTLTLNTSPANAGSFNRSSGSQYEAGNSIYMYAYNNSGYVFDYWMSADTIVSESRSFYFTMPDHDAELTAVYHYDPASPPNPDAPDTSKKYTLSLSTSPANAGSFNRSSGEQFAAGSSVYMYYYNNSGFKFDHWQSGDSIVSSSRYFYFTMPDHDTELTAVFHYDPTSPANPDTAQIYYHVTLATKPANAGTFSWNTSTDVVARRSCDIYAYPNNGFVFREWQKDGETVGTDRRYGFQMPAEDITLTAVYDYNPSNPANPNKNYWNEETGEVIVDDFTAGNLSNAVYNTTGGNYDKVQMITVAGPISQYDWGVVNNYSNCTFLDMSRTYGLSYVPSYNFSGNTTLTTIVLPAGIESIRYYAFNGCSSLTSLSCYAATPPTIGSYAFDGVQDGLVVYVPADALALYQEAEGWKDFTILPLSNQVSALEVNLPEDTDPSLYKDMYIELINAKSGQKQRYVITNRLTYTFNSLIHRTSYNVYLKNAQGDVFGEVDGIDITDHDVSVTFESLLTPRDLTLTVLTPAGDNVTDQTTITWMDGKDTYLTKGNVLTGQIEGAKAKFRIALPQSLGMEYVLPADSLYEVLAENSITYTLTAIPQTTITGKVTDIKTGQPLSGATVAISQMLNGLYSKAFTTKTDAKGEWQQTVYETKTDITASMTDYVSKTQSFETLTDSIAAFELKDINGTTISLNMTYTTTDGETQSYYSDYANVAYSVFNETTKQQVTELNVQYPQIVLMEQLPAGTELTITATSKNQKFVAVTATATVDSLDRATVTLPIKQLGGISASFKQTDNTSIVGILYDGNNRFIKKYDYSGVTLTISELTDGEYTLVTMANSQFFNSVATISQFADAGLREGIDYVKNSVTVTSGAYTAINNQLIPYLDESKLYYTGENTSFTVNKTQVTAGQYLTLRGQIDFKDTYASSVSDVKYIIDLPEGCSFVKNSVMVDNILSDYSLENDRIIIPIGKSSTIKLCVTPLLGGELNISAFVEFALNNKIAKQPIGNVSFESTEAGINVPSTTSESSIVVTGYAIANSDITVYDNDQQVGQTHSLANGFWSANIDLLNPSDLSFHNIYASVTSPLGHNMNTETQNVTFCKATSTLSKITVLYNGYTNVFDFNNPNRKSGYYSYVPSGNHAFTFIVEFNDTTGVDDVIVDVLTSANTIEELEAKYDSLKNAWVASEYFPYSNCLPINVTAEYSCIRADKFKNESIRTEELELFIEAEKELESSMENDVFYISEESDDEIIFSQRDPITNDSIIYCLRDLDYDSVRQQTFEKQFTIVNTEEDSICVYCETTDEYFKTICIDNNEKIAFEITINAISDSIVSQRRANVMKVTKRTVASLKNFFRNPGSADGGNIVQKLTGLGSFATGILDFLDLKKYLTCGKNFENLCDVLMNYIDTELDAESDAFQALLAKCPDGENRLSDTQLEKFKKRIDAAHSSADYFHEAYFAYLDVYKSQLLNAVLYDLATLGISKGAKALMKSSKYFKAIKKNKFFNAIFPEKWTKKQRQNILSNSLEMIGSYVSNALSPEFTQFENTWVFLNDWGPQRDAHIRSLFKGIKDDAKSQYKKCKTPKKPKNPKEKKTKFPNQNMTPSIDPSGYVYEAVSSNRLQGVTATAYYKETVEDMYGDLHENVVLWNAEEYAQENPLFTDEYGMYQWDVPQGLWRVKFEKEGYQTTYSEWLPVPPPQLDVNIPMTQMLQPSVKGGKAFADGVEFEFDKYMDPETLNADNIMVTKNGNTVTGEVKLLNEEVAYEGETQTYASKVRFEVPEGEELLSTDEVQLTVRKAVKSYAGIQMENDYTQKFDVELQVRRVAVDSLINVAYGGQRTLTIAALPTDAAKGKQIAVKSLSGMIATASADTLTLDENGQAELVVTGELPGSTVVNFNVVDTDVEGLMTVNVKDAANLVALAPRASRVSGTEVYRGTKIQLTSETENATIYYTLDGSCPCDLTSENVLKYNPDEPIIIADDSVTIKAMATGHDLGESEVSEFTYSLKKTAVGYQMPTGWSWISHNLEEPVPASAFQTNAERIVSQTAEVINDPVAGFIGNLAELQPAEAYKVKVTDQTENRLSGYEFNATNNAVPVVSGWNWIGYPLNQTMTLAEALAFFVPATGDYIVGQDGYAEFADDEWKGTLEAFVPGRGYLYKSAVRTEIPFNTTIVSDAVSRVGKRVVLSESPWAYNKHAWLNVMPVTAQLYTSGVKADEHEYVVGAFAGTECRGVGQWKNGRLLMSVYGDAGEDIHFMAADVNSDKFYDITEHVRFSADNVGTWYAPYVMSLGGEATGIEELYDELTVTPLVAHDHITVSAGGKNISRLMLTNLSGVTVLTLSDLGKGATVTTSTLADGMYILTVQAEGKSYYKKILKANK